jgi:hypothetical protein
MYARTRELRNDKLNESGKSLVWQIDITGWSMRLTLNIVTRYCKIRPRQSGSKPAQLSPRPQFQENTAVKLPLMFFRRSQCSFPPVISHVQVHILSRKPQTYMFVFHLVHRIAPVFRSCRCSFSQPLNLVVKRVGNTNDVPAPYIRKQWID